MSSLSVTCLPRRRISVFASTWTVTVWPLYTLACLLTRLTSIVNDSLSVATEVSVPFRIRANLGRQIF